MNKKKLEGIAYSIFGVIALMIVLVAINFLAATIRQRIDLTADKLYTLSDGTKKIVGKLDTKVKIRLYYSQRDNAMPVFLKTYAQRVEDLLVELKQQSKFIEIEKLDPQPDSDAEDSANLDGVEGQPTQTGEKIYLGISINCLDQKVALPFLSPEREKLLEYDLARAIARVANPAKPVVGVMSALPVFGTPMNPMMMRMGQGGQQPAWYLISELKSDFDVKQLEMNVTEIPADVKVLLVIHPRDITDATQFAIDQFVLRGGKLIAYLDPVSYVDQQRQGGNPMMGGGPPTSSSLDKLLGAWGIGFDKTKCIADLKYVTRMGRGQRVEQQPSVLSLTADAIDRNDIATSQVDSLMMGFTGAFTGSPVEGLKKTDLIKSTGQSQLVEGFLAQMSGEAILKDFKPSSTEYALAIKLSGKFKTAFPNGKPDAAPPAPGEEKKEAPKGDALKEAKEDNHVILVADADMLNDNFCVQIQDFFGQRIVIPRNGNINLCQNFVEQMAGDTALMNTRSRAIVQRQFTRVRDMQVKAEDAYRAKIKSVEDSLQETQRKLNELQRNKEKGQRFVLSPEQQRELENFRKKEAEVKVELKLLRRDLRRDIDAMENVLKLVNIFLMPLIVAFVGICMAIYRYTRTSAK